MWRISTSIFGLVVDSEWDSLQGCLDELRRQTRMMGFDNMDWFRIEENYEGQWKQRGFMKMG